MLGCNSELIKKCGLQAAKVRKSIVKKTPLLQFLALAFP